MRFRLRKSSSGRDTGLSGIRIDSGDLAFLSQRARQMLDHDALRYVKIVVSNELDEYVISEIIAQGGKVDMWGVGTNLVTASGDGGCALAAFIKWSNTTASPRSS